jgi:hypothetical protein
VSGGLPDEVFPYNSSHSTLRDPMHTKLASTLSPKGTENIVTLCSTSQRLYSESGC